MGKGETMDVLQRERATMPKRSYEQLSKTPLRDRARYRFHAHSEPLPEPDESMLGEQHREWLVRHKRQREQHVHPIANKIRREEQLRASKSDGLMLPSIQKAFESDG